MKSIGALIVLCVMILISCSSEQEVTVFSFTYDFSTDDKNWTGDFAGYAEGDSITSELVLKRDTLPSSSDVKDTATFLSGNNKSGYLFMFLKRKLTGLKPNATYEVLFNVKFASDEPAGTDETGALHGDSIFLKAGTTLIEPVKELQSGIYHMNIDKGFGEEEGADMITLGTLGVAPTTKQFTLTSHYNDSITGFYITTTETGEVWLIVGTDSVANGFSSIYYTQIDILLNQIQDQ